MSVCTNCQSDKIAGLPCGVCGSTEMPTSSLAGPTGSADRVGNWLDKWGACKVCDGEIPYGHAEHCDIYKLERKIAELTQLLEVTRHYRIGHEVPTEWLIKRDRAIGSPAVSPPNAPGERPGQEARELKP